MELPLEGGIVLGPQLPEDANTFIAVCATAGIGVEADGFEFFLHPSHAGTRVMRPLDRTSRVASIFADHDRIAVGENQHAGTQKQTRRAPGHITLDGLRLPIRFRRVEGIFPLGS